MSKLSVVAMIAIVALSPLAVAHFPARPVTTCQGETSEHEFALGTGRLVGEYQDGNVAECADPTYGMFFFSDDECAGTAGDPPGSLDPVTENGDPFNAIKMLDGSPADLVYQVACETDRPADWDGDLEWAVGGAVLAVSTGAIATPTGQSCGANNALVACASGAYDTNDLVETSGSALGGADNCWDMGGHHSGTVTATLDDPTGTFSNYITLVVTSNYRRAALDGLTPAQQECGDTVNEPCPVSATAVDQVNCNGRDGKKENNRAAADLATVASVAGPSVAGQDGVWIAFVGSVGCPISQTAAGACVPPPNPTAGWTGHIST